MKKSTIGILFLFTVQACFSQQVINLRLGTGAFADTTSLSNRINAKQNALINGSSLSSINGNSLLQPGNINIASIPTPEFDFYLSGIGNNGNSGGSRYFPKKTLAAIDTIFNASHLERVRVGLEAGATYRQEGIVMVRGGLDVDAYNRDKAGKFHFPTLLGSDVYNTGWVLGNPHTYQQNISNSVTISVGNYAWMYIIEIDTALERIAPYSARKYLRSAPSIAAVDTIAGSYFCPISSPPDNPTLMYLHTSDGSNPNLNSRFRYEVANKDRGINRKLGGEFGPGLTIKHLIAMDYCQGTGGFASRQDSFRMESSGVIGNGIHLGVYGNFSTINKCFYLEGDSYIEGTAVVFYQVDGANETNTVSNTYFMDNQYVLLSHTSDGDASNPAIPHHGRINFYNNYIFNSLFSLRTPRTVDTVDVNYLYCKNTNQLLSSVASKITYVRNSICESCITLDYNSDNVFVENSLYLSPKVPSQAVNILAGQKISVQHSIFHSKTTTASGNIGGVLFNNGDTSTRTNAKYNIFIGQTIPTAYTVFSHSNNYGGVGHSKDTFDYNVYIVVSGKPYWLLTDATNHGNDPSVFTLSDWQTMTGQDQHSILIDLRNYESDLKRIFVNPDAGNYNLTDSPQADSVRAIIDNRGNSPAAAGMRTPLSSFINKPSREQVVDIVESDKFVGMDQLLQTSSSGASAGYLNMGILEKMTKAQRDAIVQPVIGRKIYQTDNGPGERLWNGTNWLKNTTTTD